MAGGVELMLFNSEHNKVGGSGGMLPRKNLNFQNLRDAIFPRQVCHTLQMEKHLFVKEYKWIIYQANKVMLMYIWCVYFVTQRIKRILLQWKKENNIIIIHKG